MEAEGVQAHSCAPQASSEKTCRLFEDQMNEAKTKSDELQRQLNDSNSQRARAQTESGKVVHPSTSSDPSADSRLFPSAVKVS